ncbi:MAG: oligosaccharide flippase family protein [Candidatus Kapabacteria bacterium]|jgi:O-antigen/teichoic acid export membrane protein|nr:oligosaccharide flippase family protein [Candidatus Kapabacteria bacterium]
MASLQNRLKSLVSDTMIYGVFTIVGRFLSFMLTPMYTNYLTMEEMGSIGYIFPLIAFVNLFYCFGIDSAFMRFFKEGDLDNNRKVFSHAYTFIMLIGGIFTFFLMFNAEAVAAAISSSSRIDPNLIRIAVLIPFLDSLMVVPYGLLRMTRHAKKFAITRFILIIIAVVLNFVFIVNLDFGPTGAFAAQLIATTIGVIILLPEVIKHLKFTFDKKLFKSMLMFALPTLPATLSGMVLQVADRPILELLANDRAVAMYTVNYRLGIPMMIFVAIFEYAWKPFYLNRHKDKDAKQLFSRIMTYFTLMCASVFLTTGFLMEFMVRAPGIGGRFINPEYWSGMGIIPIILAGYYFNGVFNNFAAGFHIEKKTKYLPIAVGSAAIVNIALNFILIPIIGYWGAAWATLSAYIVSAVTLYFFARKVYPIDYEWRRISVIIFSTAAVFSLVNYFGDIFLYIVSAFVYIPEQLSAIGEYSKLMLRIASVDMNVDALANIPLILSFAAKVLAVGLFLILLKLLGFFSGQEIAMIKKLFKRA